MKRPLLIAAGVMLAVVIVVLFVPGVSEYIEGQLLSRLAAWSQ